MKRFSTCSCNMCIDVLPADLLLQDGELNVTLSRDFEKVTDSYFETDNIFHIKIKIPTMLRKLNNTEHFGCLVCWK